MEHLHINSYSEGPIMRMTESRNEARAHLFTESRSFPQASRRHPQQGPKTTASAAIATGITPAVAQAVAKEAYTFGFPLVESYRRLHAWFVKGDGADFKGSWNRIHHESMRAAAKPRPPMPNVDVAWSYLGADLRGEPLVLTVPPIDRGRYYSLQFIDMHGSNFAYVGSRTKGHKGGRYLLAGPQWIGVKPASIDRAIPCETELAFVRYRTQVLGDDDISRVNSIRAGYKIQPLSTFLGRPARLLRNPIDFPTPPAASQAFTSLEFFSLLNALLQFCPRRPADRALMARFNALGIGAGQTFDARLLPPDVYTAMSSGIVDAWHAATEVSRRVADGTLSPAALHGPRSSVPDVYRMAAALDDVHGDSVEELASWITYADADGERLNAKSRRYALRFHPEQLPPTHAMWSITLYELPSQQLYASPSTSLGAYTPPRHAITSMMLPQLHRDADGGLTIDIQHEAPAAEREANWLPAPEGPLAIAARLYVPTPEAYGMWKMPRLRRIE
jgi:hypothetical protein